MHLSSTCLPSSLYLPSSPVAIAPPPPLAVLPVAGVAHCNAHPLLCSSTPTTRGRLHDRGSGPIHQRPPLAAWHVVPVHRVVPPQPTYQWESHYRPFTTVPSLPPFTTAFTPPDATTRTAMNWCTACLNHQRPIHKPPHA